LHQILAEDIQLIKKIIGQVVFESKLSKVFKGFDICYVEKAVENIESLHTCLDFTNDILMNNEIEYLEFA